MHTWKRASCIIRMHRKVQISFSRRKQNTYTVSRSAEPGAAVGNAENLHKQNKHMALK
jgi:hypothetical protein